MWILSLVLGFLIQGSSLSQHLANATSTAVAVEKSGRDQNFGDGMTGI